MNFIFLKRLFDIFFGILFFFISLPVLVAAAIVMLFETKKTPFFCQHRGVTLTNGRVKIYKLRTMRNGEELHKKEILAEDIFMKPALAEFVTPIGAFLRRTGIDEIPQLLNVVKGEMSLLGPRPLTLSDLNAMQKKHLDYYNQRDKIISKPGISGLWQVKGNRANGIEDLLFFDKMYDRKKSLLFDFKLMVETTYLMLSAKNSDAITKTGLNK